MTDIALVILFTLAIAIGFLLGRRSKKENMLAAASFSPNKSYFQGLNFLLNEQPDKAVEEFVRLLDVNTHTLDTHLALGKLMRKQGQVDRAIRIHQNLLARPQLEVSDQHQVHLELARDFMAAGLLDRAETLLQEVIVESSDLRSIAQRYLIDIYQDESEWQAAIDVAQVVLQSRYMKSNTDARREISRMVAHFYCQLAEESDKTEDYNAVSRYLDLAAVADKTVLRVAMLTGANENAIGKHKQAIKVMSKIEVQSPAWFALCLPVLLDSYMQLNQEQGFKQFIQHLLLHVEKNKSILVLIFLVDQLLSKVDEEPHCYDQAKQILSNYVDRFASVTAANKLVALRFNQPEESVPNDIKSLHSQVTALLAKRNLYRCGNCGFSGRQLHWRCPSCKRWESIYCLEDQHSG